MNDDYQEVLLAAYGARRHEATRRTFDSCCHSGNVSLTTPANNQNPPGVQISQRRGQEMPVQTLGGRGSVTGTTQAPAGNRTVRPDNAKTGKDLQSSKP